MKKYYFDTSAVNKLRKTYPKRTLMRKIGKSIHCYTSVFTIAEIACTSKYIKRLLLLRFLKKLSNGFRPIGMPGEILRNEFFARESEKPNVNITMSSNWDGLWVAFNKPWLLRKPDIDEVRIWKKNEEDKLLRIFREGRMHIQESIDKLNNVERRNIKRSYSSMMKSFIDTENFLKDRINDFLKITNPGRKLSQNQAMNLINYSEFWRLFLAALGYMFYTFSVKEEGFSTRNNRNPGSIDLQQAMYLPACDYFVTDDRRQKRALKIISRFGRHKTQILTVSEFIRIELISS